MKNLYIQLWTVNIDFESKDFESEEMAIAEWSLENTQVQEAEIQQLFNSILINKGDWVDFDLYSTEDQVCIDIKLLITRRAPLLEEDIVIVEETKSIIESFLQNTKILSSKDKHIPTSIPSSVETVNLLKINIPGITDLELTEQVFQKMRAAGLTPCLETKRVVINESGASGGELDIILAFVSGSIGSGVTYDMVKATLMQIPLLKDAKFNWVKGEKYRQVRKLVAERANINKKSLILINFIKEEYHDYIFKSERNYIYVRIDDSNEIIKYKLSTSKREVEGQFGSRD